MTTYHMSPVTGKKEICNAKEGGCKYKDFTVLTVDDAVESKDLNSYLNAREAAATLVDIPKGDPKIEYGEMEVEFWDDIRKDFRTYCSGESEIILAEPGNPSEFCYDCHHPLTDESLTGGKTPCPGCGGLNQRGLVGVSLSYEDQKFLNTEVTRTARWYHTSNYPNWDEAMVNANGDTSLVHLGTLDAALHRARVVNNTMHYDNYYDGKSYLYEVELAEDIDISSTVHDEDRFNNSTIPTGNSDPEDKQHRGYALNGATRYVNHHEAPGSMSLLANPTKFKILSKQAIN